MKQSSTTAATAAASQAGKTGSRVEFCLKEARKQRQNIDKKRLLHTRLLQKLRKGVEVAMTGSKNGNRAIIDTFAMGNPP